MKRCWDYLVEHEKVVVFINLFLVFAFFWQLRSQNARLELTNDLPQIQAVDTSANHSEQTFDAAQNVAGSWEMTVQKKKGGIQIWTLTLKQNGEQLTGVINSEGGDLPVTGTIKGQSFNLSAKRFGVTVEFHAVLNADTMTGEMRVLTISRQWTSKRRM
jgi:hypothetical protein